MHLFSEDYQLWERQFAIEGGLRSAEFAGANDEFIVAYDDHHLYKFNTETSQMLDSIYYEKDVYSCVASNDGLIYYTSIEDEILLYDVNTMEVIDTIPSPEISSEAPNNSIRAGISNLGISENDKLLTFRYAESFDNQYRHYEFIVHDLEQRKIIARVGDNERNYRSQFYNPTFTPNAETLLVVVERPENNFQESETQLWFYDIKNGTLINIGDKEKFRNNVAGNSEFTFLNEKEVHISNSVLPNLNGFNILNMESGLMTDYFNFKNLKYNVYSGKPVKLDDNLVIISLASFQEWQTLLMFYNITNRDTVTTFVLDGRSIQLNANNIKSFMIGYNNNYLYLYNLSKYLKIASIKPINLFSEIKLSPNPSQNREFNLILNSVSNMNINLSLYNIIGQKALEIKNDIFINEGENQIEFNLQNELPPGQYFLRIETERGNQDVKIQL